MSPTAGPEACLEYIRPLIGPLGTSKVFKKHWEEYENFDRRYPCPNDEEELLTMGRKKTKIAKKAWEALEKELGPRLESIMTKEVWEPIKKNPRTWFSRAREIEACIEILEEELSKPSPSHRKGEDEWWRWIRRKLGADKHKDYLIAFAIELYAKGLYTADKKQAPPMHHKVKDIVTECWPKGDWEEEERKALDWAKTEVEDGKYPAPKKQDRRLYRRNKGDVESVLRKLRERALKVEEKLP
jgi:HEPN domain-containing protein